MLSMSRLHGFLVGLAGLYVLGESCDISGLVRR